MNDLGADLFKLAVRKSSTINGRGKKHIADNVDPIREFSVHAEKDQ